MVLDIFRTAFSNGRLPKKQFPKWQLPKCAISQAATSQRLGQVLGGFTGCYGRPSAAARVGQRAEHCVQNRLGAECCGQDRLGKLPLGKLHSWEVATWENTLGKLPLRKKPLGKYLTSFRWLFLYLEFYLKNFLVQHLSYSRHIQALKLKLTGD